MGLKALTFLTAGESHGQQLTILVQNVPAGLSSPAADSTSSSGAARAATAAAGG